MPATLHLAHGRDLRLFWLTGGHYRALEGGAIIAGHGRLGPLSQTNSAPACAAHSMIRAFPRGDTGGPSIAR
jgi:hypothetical protein